MAPECPRNNLFGNMGQPSSDARTHNSMERADERMPFHTFIREQLHLSQSPTEVVAIIAGAMFSVSRLDKTCALVACSARNPRRVARSRHDWNGRA